jgi:hypothetical protein
VEAATAMPRMRCQSNAWSRPGSFTVIGSRGRTYE